MAHVSFWHDESNRAGIQMACSITRHTYDSVIEGYGCFTICAFLQIEFESPQTSVQFFYGKSFK